MTRKQRIIQQRVLVREAFGKLEAVAEMFGMDDETDSLDSTDEWERFQGKLSELHQWMWDEGPLA